MPVFWGWGLCRRVRPPVAGLVVGWVYRKHDERVGGGFGPGKQCPHLRTSTESMRPDHPGAAGGSSLQALPQVPPDDPPLWQAGGGGSAKPNVCPCSRLILKRRESRNTALQQAPHPNGRLQSLGSRWETAMTSWRLNRRLNREVWGMVTISPSNEGCSVFGISIFSCVFQICVEMKPQRNLPKGVLLIIVGNEPSGWPLAAYAASHAGQVAVVRHLHSQAPVRVPRGR